MGSGHDRNRNRETTALQSPVVKPRFGVRLPRGIVTYWGDVPLTTWELADECREKIEQFMGERGEIEEVFVL